MLPRNVLYFGGEQFSPERNPLRAGPLTLFFEHGDLRRICYGEREILRRVYVAVRDHNWDTPPTEIVNLEITPGERSFQIGYDVVCQKPPIDFRWRAEISGQEDGTITFSMDGQAYTEFWRNRIGFCVLHPIQECAGKACVVEQVDGSRVEGHFPTLIAPHQPFKEIRAIHHEIVPGLRAEVRMQGETFEMEDQRNWTDASFKTYCTPLELPYPVRVTPGERVQQSVQIKLEGTWEQDDQPVEADQSVTISLRPGRLSGLPAIGLGLAVHREKLSAPQINRLRALNLAHLRVDLQLGEDGWRSQLQQGAEQAAALDCALEIALHLPEGAETALINLHNELEKVQPKIARWIIYPMDENSDKSKWLALACKILGDYDPAAPFGCGADSNFTEFNRNPPDYTIPDFMSYAANPQVHAFDNHSLIENLAGLGETVISARRLSAGKPIVVSPVTFKARFNPVATSPEIEIDAEQLPAQVDPRQMSLFGAGWTLGSLKYLAENGASSITFYQTTGWLGVMETDKGPPLPAAFPSIPGAVFPIFHILADVGEFAGGQVVHSKSSQPLQVDCLALRNGDQQRLLVANLEDRPVQIRVRGLPAEAQVKILDESNAQKAMQAPTRFRQQPGETFFAQEGSLSFEMKPYATLRIDTKWYFR
jgi:hypothetical protein